MSKLLLIDGHSQAYRAFFGVKSPLSTRSGELTGAVFGFTRKLLSVLKEYEPEHVAVAFDLGDTWRHAEFSPYKATRERMPDEMRTQMGRIQEVLEVLNIPVITYPNYEADDVLGTLSRKATSDQVADGESDAAQSKTEVLILTGDRDLFQLITEQVKILYTSGGPNPKTTPYGLEELDARYGLTPDQFIDLKALTGDASDNIPGIPGVGDKTATKFLKEHGTLDLVYEHVDTIRGPKTRQNVINAEAQVRLNKRLVTIVTDLDIDYDPDACRLRDYEQGAVINLFKELEFRSLLKDLPQAGVEAVLASDTSVETTGQMGLFSMGDTHEAKPLVNPYLCVQTQEDFQEVITGLQGAEFLSFDVETTSTDAMQAKLVGLGIAWAVGEAAYIPLAHQEGTQLDWPMVRDALQPFFDDPKLTKLAHNGKYDLTVCRQHGLQIQGEIHDTMTMAWLLDPMSHRLGLKAQAADLLDIQMTEITELIGTGRKQITMDQVSIEKAAPYGAADVDVALKLYLLLSTRLREAGIWALYETLELPLLPVLTDMEMAGILLDSDFLAEMSSRLTQRIFELEEALFKIVGHRFNLRSTQQLSAVLFEEMGFPSKGLKKTRAGRISTAVSELERLAHMTDKLSADQQRLLEIIFEQRQLEKLRGTYVDALPALVNGKTDRVHTSYNQTGAVTGRISSSNPNLQNIPIRTPLGREVRRAFVAPPGWHLVAADYSQVELRVLAHVAREDALLEAFRADLDIHSTTASHLFDVPIDQVDRTQRGLAKTINFATIYGVSAFGLSSRTEMTPKQAQKFLEQYFQTYPRIKTYIDETIQVATQEGVVETLLGRKRHFPELQNARLPYQQRMGIERAAINAPIQGAAADIMKIAMIRLHQRLQEKHYQARILLQVHDELVLEVPSEELDEVVHLVREVMQSAYTLDVPLKVDVEVGKNWYDMESVETFKEAPKRGDEEKIEMS